MKKSLKTKLLYSFMTVIIVVVLGMMVGSSYLISDYFFKTKEEELSQKGSEMASTVEYFITVDGRKSTLLRYLVAVERLVGARVWLFDADYNLIAASSVEPGFMKSEGGNIVGMEASTIPSVENTEKLAKELKYGAISESVRSILEKTYKGDAVNSQIFHPYFKEQVILVGVPYGDENQPQGAILLAEPISGFDKFMRNIYLYVFLVGMMALLVSVIMIRSLSVQVVKPLINMRDKTKAIAKGNYSGQIEVYGEDEVADLGRAINALNRDLRDYTEKVEKMERIRRDFVANVSHELRTPITIIRGYIEIINDSLTTESEYKRFCTLIIEETKRLERLVRELLKISRLQATDEWGPSDLDRLPLSEIIRTVAEKLEVKAAPRDISIKLDLTENVDIMGNGDQIVQLILLLGDNAIKYSPEGSYVLYKTYLKENGALVVEVTDNGNGIPAEDLPFIFERFYKVDKSHTCSKTKGTGLGLAIAREIVRMHGATINVESVRGEGTSFIIEFPAASVKKG